MPGADGYITYSTKLDNENLEKDLSSTTKKIESLEKQLQKNSDKRLPISRRVSELGGQLDEAKAKLVSLQDEAQRVAQQKTVDGLQAKFDRAADQLDTVDMAAKRISSDLTNAKDRAGKLAEELYKPATAADAVASAVEQADQRIKKFSSRLKSLAKRVFVFTLITTALRSVKDWMGSVIKSNSEASAAIARLKGALLTWHSRLCQF